MSQPSPAPSSTDAYAAYLARLKRKPRALPGHMNRPMDSAFQAVVVVFATALFWGAAWQMLRSLPSDRSAWPAWVWPALAMFVVAGPAVGLLADLQKLRLRALARGGEIVEGALTDVDTIHDLVRYQYVVAGQTHAGVHENARIAELAERGSRVWICYDVRSPQRSVYYDVLKEPDDPALARRDSLELALAANDQQIRSRVLFILGVPVVFGGIALLVMVFQHASKAALEKPVAPTADSTSTPAPVTEAAVSCTCTSVDGTKAPRVEMSLALEHDRYDSYTWRMETKTGPKGQSSDASSTLATLANTVPEYPGREPVRRLRMGIACDGSVVMFVAGRRATGWTSDGHSAWSVALPGAFDAPQGGKGVECSALPVKNGVATVELAHGKPVTIAIANGHVR